MDAELSPAAYAFIEHWGTMGPKWGVSRSVAEVHALLYIVPEAIPADEIAATLGIARSNVSMCLKELSSWGIIRVERVSGDRRDHFRSDADVWRMFQAVMDERKKRELDPTLTVLRECLDQDGTRAEKRRIKEMLSFFETMASLYHQMRALPPSAIRNFGRMGAKLRQLFGKGA